MIIKDIKTDRLYLRKFQGSDYKDLYEYLSHQEIKEALNFDGCTVEECIKIVNSRAKGDTYFAVTMDDKMIGHIEFHKTKYEGVYEIGYVFNPQYSHQGYAYESLLAVIQYAHELNVIELVASTSPKNEKSKKLLFKLGLTLYEGVNKSDYYDEGDLQFSLIL